MAERPGFEPGVEILSPQRFSKPSLSAAQPPLLYLDTLKKFFCVIKSQTYSSKPLTLGTLVAATPRQAIDK